MRNLKSRIVEEVTLKLLKQKGEVRTDEIHLKANQELGKRSACTKMEVIQYIKRIEGVFSYKKGRSYMWYLGPENS